MAAYLPTTDEADRDTFEHPWLRSYSRRTRARWEDDPNYCHNKSLISRTGRILNDLVDMAIFDFLTGRSTTHLSSNLWLVYVWRLFVSLRSMVSDLTIVGIV